MEVFQLRCSSLSRRLPPANFANSCFYATNFHRISGTVHTNPVKIVYTMIFASFSTSLLKHRRDSELCLRQTANSRHTFSKAGLLRKLARTVVVVVLWHLFLADSFPTEDGCELLYNVFCDFKGLTEKLIFPFLFSFRLKIMLSGKECQLKKPRGGCRQSYPTTETRHMKRKYC